MKKSDHKRPHLQQDQHPDHQMPPTTNGAPLLGMPMAPGQAPGMPTAMAPAADAS